MLTSTASSLFNTDDSIAMPCSVKTYGKYLRPPLVLIFVVEICDLKFILLYLVIACYVTAATSKSKHN